MSNNNQIYNMEFEVYLKDLWFYILKHWKFGVILLFAGLIIGLLALLFIKQVKSLFIVLLLAFFMWFIICLVSYIVNTNVKTVEEIQRVFCLPLICHVRKRENLKKNAIDKFIIKWEEKFKLHYEDKEYLVSALNLLPNQYITVCGDISLKSSVYWMKAAKESSKVAVGSFLSQNKESLVDAKETGGVILVVQIKETKRALLQREMMTCHVHNIPIIGVIAVD